jgi:ComEC/Rec2-related protein
MTRLQRAATFVRKRLFGSVLDAIVTVLCAALIVRLAIPALNWLVLDATWTGTTRADCTGSGACWVFIRARFGQFMYGLYPVGERWRVDIAGLLLVGAIALLAWNPYTFFDAGFQLSFAAVVAIFVLVPRFQNVLEGYPLGRLRPAIAVSAACGLATAPILWLQFHSLQLLAVPANALAAPAVVPLLILALAAAALTPVSGGAAAALAWLNGWCAAYLATVARVIGGLPFAQIRSTRTLVVLLAGALLAAAYASERSWQSTRSQP